MKHFALWCIAIGLAIYLVDLACGHFLAWRERRDAFIRDAQLKRYCITPMFGTKKCDDPRWLS